MEERNCPTCQLIATGGIFFDAKCTEHDKETDKKYPFFKWFRPTFYFDSKMIKHK